MTVSCLLTVSVSGLLILAEVPGRDDISRRGAGLVTVSRYPEPRQGCVKTPSFSRDDKGEPRHSTVTAIGVWLSRVTMREF